MKKIVFMIVATLSIMMLVPVFAAEEVLLISPAPQTIKVQLNGEMINFTDSAGNTVNPQIINDRTMVPMRKIFEELGSTVDWEEETQKVTAKKDGIEIGLQIENEKATIKNESGEITEITLDSVPVVVDDRTLVPVRFIAESLHKKVDWDAQNRTVIIIDLDLISNTLKEKAPTFYEYLEDNSFVVNSYTANGEITGKLKYTDASNKSNTSTLALTGSYLAKVNEKLMSAEAKTTITGKGSLMDAVKDSNLDKISANIIFDVENGCIMVNGTMFDEEYQDKWIKYVFAGENIEEYQAEMASFQIANGTNTVEMLDSLLQNAEGLTIDSYPMIQEILDMICQLVSDKNFTVEKSRTSNTYTYTIGLKDILSVAQLTDEEIKEIEKIASFKMESTIVSKEHVPTNTTTEITFSYTENDETVDGELKLIEKIKDINEKIEVVLPNEKDVVEQQLY